MDDQSHSSPDKLSITGPQRPAPPTYACLIYTMYNADGKVTARIANLAGFELTAATERDALQRICKQFKSHLLQKTEAGGTIDWIDPPSPRKDDEKVRSIPVHL